MLLFVYFYKSWRFVDFILLNVFIYSHIKKKGKKWTVLEEAHIRKHYSWEKSHS